MDFDVCWIWVDWIGIWASLIVCLFDCIVLAFSVFACLFFLFDLERERAK